MGPHRGLICWWVIGCGERTHVRQNAEGVLGAECNEAIRGLLPEDENTPKRIFAIPPCPPSCFAHSRFAGLARANSAKQDALRSFSEEGRSMHYVYLIKSIAPPEERYAGASAVLRRRISDHSAGKSRHTAKFKPWELVTYVAFSNRAQAEQFERYLK